MKARLLLTVGHLFVSTPLFCAQLSKTAIRQHHALNDISDLMQNNNEYAQKINNHMLQLKTLLKNELALSFLACLENHSDHTLEELAILSPELIINKANNHMKEHIQALDIDKKAQDYLWEQIKTDMSEVAGKYFSDPYEQNARSLIELAKQLQNPTTKANEPITHIHVIDEKQDQQ